MRSLEVCRCLIMKILTFLRQSNESKRSCIFDTHQLSLFFSLASRSYFSRVLLSTIPVKYMIWPPMVDLPASKIHVNRFIINIAFFYYNSHKSYTNFSLHFNSAQMVWFSKLVQWNQNTVVITNGWKMDIPLQKLIVMSKDIHILWNIPGSLSNRNADTLLLAQWIFLNTT